MDLTAKKQTIRRLALARRARLTTSERDALGKTLMRRLITLPEVAGAPSVLAFVSISTEIETEPLLRAVLESGRRLLLPYVGEDGTLKAAAVESLNELEPGYRGIPEPRHRVPGPATEASVIVVPGVAFDDRGGRLGYGGGFYDRFLEASGSRALRIGICFEAQMVEEVPTAGHDQPVDVVVTEERVMRAAR